MRLTCELSGKHAWWHEISKAMICQLVIFRSHFESPLIFVTAMRPRLGRKWLSVFLFLFFITIVTYIVSTVDCLYHFIVNTQFILLTPLNRIGVGGYGDHFCRLECIGVQRIGFKLSNSTSNRIASILAWRSAVSTFRKQNLLGIAQLLRIVSQFLSHQELWQAALHSP